MMLVKKYITAGYMAMFTIVLLNSTACQTQRDSVTAVADGEYVSNKHEDQDLAKMPGITDVRSTFTVHLESQEGLRITDPTQLAPNTLYKLVVTGTAPVEYRVKKTEGFQIMNYTKHTKKKSLTNNSSIINPTTEFTIKTYQAMPDRLYVNIVPVHNRQGKYYREYSQVFLLPAGQK
ncbi:hypothetical protein QNI16_37770 [Cytophagaceae bacterium YF14B1]|uniref:Uncharacterized protein n=1 Tax=Xanthocytophaga flava TaxID=3048013 RepID=A0AAE3QZB2_9BACT|nr:hypothetical protein [Xanthocytophaga flavus]MDJ1486290.1 hypothetical protein [Xanthocytophaga flavus]